MADSTDDRIGQEWQEGGGSGHMQAVVITPEMRADRAWRAFITHTQGCATCRAGVDCDQVGELKQTYLAAKSAAA